MKAFLAVLLLASPMFAASAETQPLGAPGCGAADAKFEVKTDKSQHPLATPDAGKAQVVFIEDDSEFGSRPFPTTRFGVDGSWVGATHGNSYLEFSVDPGEHHLCASWQTTVIVTQGHKSAAAHFTAAAGESYYFAVKNKWTRDLGTAVISLTPLDSDEGQLLAAKFALSASQLKK
jgi:hypothetical protein